MSNDIHTYTVSKLRFSFGEKNKTQFSWLYASNSSFMNMINIAEKRECTMVRQILCGDFSLVKMINTYLYLFFFFKYLND
jgi:hypothetical protein